MDTQITSLDTRSQEEASDGKHGEERRQRRDFSPELKLEAVRLATSGEKSVRQVAREMVN